MVRQRVQDVDTAKIIIINPLFCSSFFKTCLLMQGSVWTRLSEHICNFQLIQDKRYLTHPATVVSPIKTGIWDWNDSLRMKGSRWIIFHLPIWRDISHWNRWICVLLSHGRNMFFRTSGSRCIKVTCFRVFPFPNFFSLRSINRDFITYFSLFTFNRNFLLRSNGRDFIRYTSLALSVDWLKGGKNLENTFS